MKYSKSKIWLKENMKFLRKKYRVSQKQLAFEISVTRGAIGSYEEGRAMPAIETLVRMCQYFDVSMDIMVRQNIKSLL